jgi:hypothetical protein
MEQQIRKVEKIIGKYAREGVFHTSLDLSHELVAALEAKDYVVTEGSGPSYTISWSRARAPFFTVAAERYYSLANAEIQYIIDLMDSKAKDKAPMEVEIIYDETKAFLTKSGCTMKKLDNGSYIITT